MELETHKIGPDPVTCAMPIVQPFLPQKLAGKSVQGEAARALGKDRSVECDVSLQYQGISFPFHLRGFPEVHGSSRIGRPVVVLPTRVTEIHRFGIDDRTVADLWLIVYDSSIRPGRGDGVEGESREVFALARMEVSVSFLSRTTKRQMTVRSDALEPVRSLYFIDHCVLLRQLLLEPGKVFDQRGAISNVTGPHSR